MKRKTRIIISIGVIFIVIIFSLGRCLVGLKNGNSEIRQSEMEDLPYSYVLPNEYVSLFTKERFKKIIVDVVRNSKVRNPVASLDYEKKYRIFVIKVNLVDSNALLKTLLHEETENLSDIPAHYVYNFIEAPGYDFHYIAELINQKPIEYIYLGFSGDSLKTILKTYSIAVYYLLCHSFSIRYSKEEIIDILITPKSKNIFYNQLIPLDVIMIKRNKAIYFLTLSPFSKDDFVTPDLLYNLINKAN